MPIKSYTELKLNKINNRFQKIILSDIIIIMNITLNNTTIKKFSKFAVLTEKIQKQKDLSKLNKVCLNDAIIMSVAR